MMMLALGAYEEASMGVELCGTRRFTILLMVFKLPR